MNQVDLNRMRIFKQVVTSGSFSKAALQLGQPKSRISRNISALEGELGLQLIYRTTRHFRLTEAGQELFNRSMTPLNELSQVLENLTASGDEVSGHLRVTAPEDLAVTLIADVCRAFIEVHPKVHIDLQCTTHMLDFVKDSIDVAIRIGKLKDSSHMRKKIGRVKIGFFISPAALTQFGRPDQIEDLESLPFLSFSHLHVQNTRLRVSNGRAQRTLKLNSVFASNNMLVLRALATQGVGVASLPAVVVQEDLRKGDLVQIFEEWGGDEIPIQVVTPHQKEPLPRVKRFTEFVTKQLSPMFN
jgi:DNA-binding transcriptional LysR family regulator